MNTTKIKKNEHQSKDRLFVMRWNIPTLANRIQVKLITLSVG